MDREKYVLIATTAVITALIVGGLFIFLPSSMEENNEQVRNKSGPDGDPRSRQRNSSQTDDRKTIENGEEQAEINSERADDSGEPEREAQDETNSSPSSEDSSEKNKGVDWITYNRNGETVDEEVENLQNFVEKALSQLKAREETEANTGRQKLHEVLFQVEPDWSRIPDIRETMLELAQQTPSDKNRNNILAILARPTYPGWENNYQEIIDELEENPHLTEKMKGIVADQAVRKDPEKVERILGDRGYDLGKRLDIMKNHAQAWEEFIANQHTLSSKYSEDWKDILEKARTYRKEVEQMAESEQ